MDSPFCRKTSCIVLLGFLFTFAFVFAAYAADDTEAPQGTTAPTAVGLSQIPKDEGPVSSRPEGDPGGEQTRRRFTLLAGLHLQSNSRYLPAVHIAAHSPRILEDRPRLSVAWATSRLSTAFGSLGLVEDWLLITPAWYFRPEKTVNPFAGADLGYARYSPASTAFKLIRNDAPVATLKAGSEFAFLDNRLRLFAEIGYSLLASSIVYPFHFALGAGFDLESAFGNRVGEEKGL